MWYHYFVLQEAGLPIGGPEFNSYIMLEVHYNNPGLRKGKIFTFFFHSDKNCFYLKCVLFVGLVDSSGIRLYITPDVRKYDAGVIELGLEYSDKMAIPPKQPDFTLSGYCIAECTAVVYYTEILIIITSFNNNIFYFEIVLLNFHAIFIRLNKKINFNLIQF